MARYKVVATHAKDRPLILIIDTTNEDIAVEMVTVEQACNWCKALNAYEEREEDYAKSIDEKE